MMMLAVGPHRRAGTAALRRPPTRPRRRRLPPPTRRPRPRGRWSPATGLKLSRGDLGPAHAEETGEAAGAADRLGLGGDGPGRGDAIVPRTTSVSPANATIDGLARSAIKVRAKGAMFKRLPDIDLDGGRRYIIRCPEPGFPDLSYDIGTLSTGDHRIDVALDIKTRRKHAHVVKSVLASFHWKEWSYEENMPSQALLMRRKDGNPDSGL